MLVDVYCERGGALYLRLVSNLSDQTLLYFVE